MVGGDWRNSICHADRLSGGKQGTEDVLSISLIMFLTARTYSTLMLSILLPWTVSTVWLIMDAESIRFVLKRMLNAGARYAS